jgi:oligopeptide/dipeptide ABC transporter ATP-binding protein
LLEIRDLHLVFHTFDGVARVLNGVNLRMRTGDMLGLVGETGCGKTITARSLLGLVPMPPGEITRGEIRFREMNLLEAPKKEMMRLRGRQIAAVFQNPTTNLNPVFSIGEQLIDVVLTHQDKPWSTLAMTPLGRLVPAARSGREKARARAVELLRRVEIPDPEARLDSYPHEFSGGMRQRVLIAMALAGQPALLIADEPTTALDVSIEAQILRLIRRLVSETGLSVLWISHNLGVVAKICTHVAVMYAGNVVEYGTAREVFKYPKHPYTQGLLNSIPQAGGLRGELVAVKGAIPDFVDPPPGCRFHPRCPHAMPKCLLEMPTTTLVSPSHEVNCFLYSEKGDHRA